MAKCEKIMIAGFSGAGKSSLLQVLRETTPENGWNFEDLDERVLKSHKRKEIAQIIADHGWEKFRLWERQELESWLKEEGSGVLSLGGGALNQSLIDLLRPIRKIRILYLHAPFEDCWRRLLDDVEEPRPLLKLGKGELHRIYEDRQKLFSQLPWKMENSEGTDLLSLARTFWSSIL